MEEVSAKIDASYENFWSKRNGNRVYPTEFVVRVFLATYPGLNFPKLKAGDRVLDVAFGDGRNTYFLCDQGFQVSGIEITQRIVDRTSERLQALGHILICVLVGIVAYRLMANTLIAYWHAIVVTIVTKERHLLII